MTNVVIASAARTAVGSFGGAFANTPAHDLGAAVLEAVVARAGIDKSEVSETILGQVLTAGQGQNPARQAHVNAGLPIESSPFPFIFCAWVHRAQHARERASDTLHRTYKIAGDVPRLPRVLGQRIRYRPQQYFTEDKRRLD